MSTDVLDEVLVAAVVVLYNSNQQVLTNIDTYIHQVDKLYIVDNSEVVNKNLVTLLETRPKVNYYWMGENAGIAAALNEAAELSVHAGYQYLLMMDDDSQLTEKTVNSLVDYYLKHGQAKQIGIVTAQSDPNLRGESAESVWYSITSGSLLNLSAYQTCGLFMNELFIDGVDHEYCYRLKQFGYEVVILNYVSMPHRMGIPEEVSLFGKIVYRWSSHSPLRSYYLIRNFLFILNQYKALLPTTIKREVYYGIVKACLLDLVLGRQKLLRLQYVGKAIADYKNNRFGKISQN